MLQAFLWLQVVLDPVFELFFVFHCFLIYNWSEVNFKRYIVTSENCFIESLFHQLTDFESDLLMDYIAKQKDAYRFNVSLSLKENQSPTTN